MPEEYKGLNPIKMWKENRKRKREADKSEKDRKDKDRKAWEEKVEKTRPGSGPFYRYPTDQFFWDPIGRIMIIPEGYLGVRQRLGSLGQVKSFREDPEGNEIYQGKRGVVKRRGFPWAGLEEPGLKVMISGYGLLSRMAVVNTQQQEKDIDGAKLFTKDGIETKIDATFTYHVVDPVRAMTKGQEKGYQELVEDLATMRLSGVVNSRSLSELQDDVAGTNLIKNRDGTNYNIPELELIGIEIDGIYIKSINPPNNLAQALGAEAIARSEAKALNIRASADADAAVKHEAAGKIYDASPGARRVYEGSLSRSQGSGFYNFAGLEGIAEALGKIATGLLDKRKSE